MGFGKLLKDITDGVREKNEERKQRQNQEKLREYQQREDVAAGRFCKICARTGEFENKCDDCLKFPICNDCCATNERYGTICANCFPKYQCAGEGCNILSNDECVVCNRQVCQSEHWYPFFVEKGKFFSCIYDKGNVCKYCVEEGKHGTFTKHYDCPKCGNELHQKTIN